MTGTTTIRLPSMTIVMETANGLLRLASIPSKGRVDNPPITFPQGTICKSSMRITNQRPTVDPHPDDQRPDDPHPDDPHPSQFVSRVHPNWLVVDLHQHVVPPVHPYVPISRLPNRFVRPVLLLNQHC